MLILRFSRLKSRSGLPATTTTLTTPTPLTSTCWQTPCANSSRGRVWKSPCTTLPLTADRRSGWGQMHACVRALSELWNMISSLWLTKSFLISSTGGFRLMLLLQMVPKKHYYDLCVPAFYFNVQLHSKLCKLDMCSLYTCVCACASLLHLRVSTTENCVWSQCYHLWGNHGLHR